MSSSENAPTPALPGSDGPAEVELWRAADVAFEQVLALAPEARAAALAAMALTPAVEARVLRLLHADAAAETEAVAVKPMPAPGLVGRRLGAWVLDEELGRGGMAVVYRAHSVDPPRREAAIKCLPLATSAQGVERFQREQSILARLNHPRIVPLLDAGRAEDGSFWLAMRRVDGSPIDHWCSAQALDLSARVRLLLEVCEAVAHAHRALVVHRDIKPSNVLVDAEGHAHLLDFGIARLTDEGADDATLTRWRALSPAYAAPEQFHGAAASTAMDVFGLGALLYTLLCGHPPRAGLAPDAPITQPSRRRGAPGELHLPAPKQLRGDLDAICLRALELDPARRYPSVDALAEDLQRWQQGRPVQARAPSLLYRAGRRLRRHALPFAFAGLAVLALLAGSLLAMQRADEAQRARAEAEAGRMRADALRDFLQGVLETQIPGRPREELPSTAVLLQEAETLAMGADGSPQVRADMLDSITLVWIARGDSTRGQRLVEASLELAAAANLAPELAAEVAARALLRRAQLRRITREPDAALSDLEAARVRLGSQTAARLRGELELERAHLLGDQRRFEDALDAVAPLLGEAGKVLPARIRQRVLTAAALYLGQLGQHLEAQSLREQALAEMRTLYGERHLRVAVMLANLANSDRALGRFELAESRFLQALDIYAQVLDAPSEYRGSAHLGLGWLAFARGDFERARAEFEQGNAEIAVVRGFAKAEDYDVYHWNRGLALAAGGRTQAARETLQRALEGLSLRPPPYAGMRAVAAAWWAISACAAGEAGGPALQRQREELALTPALSAEDRALTVESEATCALAAGQPDAALKALVAQREADDRLSTGLAADVARRRLLAAAAADRLDDGAEARRLREEARARLQAAGLSEHPLMKALDRAEGAQTPR